MAPNGTLVKVILRMELSVVTDLMAGLGAVACVCVCVCVCVCDVCAYACEREREGGKQVKD